MQSRPLGVEFKNNVKKAWWKKFVQESKYNVGLDSAILMNPQTWVTSCLLYTSLYKLRQEQFVQLFPADFPLIGKTRDFLFDFCYAGTEIFVESPDPVSYTHLDVYKRQCSRRPTAASLRRFCKRPTRRRRRRMVRSTSR